jgi:hypothetical protein
MIRKCGRDRSGCPLLFLDGAHRLELFERQRVAVAVSLAVAAEDAGQFQDGPGHRA